MRPKSETEPYLRTVELVVARTGQPMHLDKQFRTARNVSKIAARLA